jgi:hypothetical protein
MGALGYLLFCDINVKYVQFRTKYLRYMFTSKTNEMWTDVSRNRDFDYD